MDCSVAGIDFPLSIHVTSKTSRMISLLINDRLGNATAYTSYNATVIYRIDRESSDGQHWFINVTNNTVAITGLEPHNIYKISVTRILDGNSSKTDTSLPIFVYTDEEGEY